MHSEMGSFHEVVNSFQNVNLYVVGLVDPQKPFLVEWGISRCLQANGIAAARAADATKCTNACCFSR